MIDFTPFPGLPEASAFAGEVDALFFAMVGLAALLLISLYVLITVFAIRYRAGREHVPRESEEEHELRAEVLWTVIPVIAFIGLFLWSVQIYLEEKSPPPDAIDIYVVAKQWMWKVEHMDGRRELNQLHIPLGTPVKLIMTSQDVIHSFYVPAFRIKQDVLPGRYESLWFKATQTGRFSLLCAEFCGTQHSKMRGEIVVEEPDRYAEWLQRGEPRQSLAGRGATLFLRHGCSGCHATGSPVRAPLLDGLFGSLVRLSNGSNVIANEDYVRDAILLPDKQVVAGFQSIMPSFTGVLSESDVLALIAFIQSLDEPAEDAPPGAVHHAIETATEHATGGAEGDDDDR